MLIEEFEFIVENTSRKFIFNHERFVLLIEVRFRTGKTFFFKIARQQIFKRSCFRGRIFCSRETEVLIYSIDIREI